MTSGTNLHSRYHPGYSPKENPSSGSNKPYPCNGRTRILLLAYAFTRSTQESDRQIHRIGSHHPPTLCKLQDKANFPSMSFYMVEHIKPHPPWFVNSHHLKKYTLVAFHQKKTVFCVNSLAKRHLTFHRGHARILSIQKKAVTKTVRQTGISESQHLVQADRTVPQDPSLPS